MQKHSRWLCVAVGLTLSCRGILGIEEPLDLVAQSGAGSSSVGGAGGMSGTSGRGAGANQGGESGSAGNDGGSAGNAGDGGDAGNGGRSPEDLAGELAKLKTPEGLTNDQASPADATAQGEPDVSSTNLVGEDGVPWTTTVSLQDFATSAIFDTQVLLDPASRRIYPGAVLVGSSIHDGSYLEVTSGTKHRATVVYSGLVAGGSAAEQHSGTLVPSFASYQALHGELTGGALESAGTAYTVSTTEVSTESAFDVHFAESVSYPVPAAGDAVKAPIDFEQASLLRRYLIRFVQTYYTVELELEPNTLLYEDFEVEDFRGYRPVYVASVAYGRLGHLTLESPAPRATIESGIEAILEDPSLASEDDVPEDVSAVQDSQRFRGVIIGSDTELSSLDELADYLEAEGFSPARTGQIVGYRLRFVDDGSPANSIYEASYAHRSTTEEAGYFDVEARLVSITYASNDVGGTKPEIIGKLELQSGTSSYSLFNHTGLASVVVNPDGVATSVTEPTRAFSLPSLESTLDFEVTAVEELDPLGMVDPYGDVTQSNLILQSMVDETAAGSGVYRGNHLIRAPGEDASDYVEFNVRLEATANFPGD